MLQLRSNLRFLALGCALTSMFGLNASQEDAACQRCKPKPRPAAKERAIYQEMNRIAKNTQTMFDANSEIRGDIVKTLAPRALCSSKHVVDFAKPAHYLRELSPNGDLITIQDGSVWAIKEADHVTAKAWHPHSDIVITPNSLSLWGKLTRKELMYKYRIYNVASKTAVNANLSLGPFKQDPHTLRIRRIDRENGMVYFTNGSRWHCEQSNVSKQIFAEWRVGHFVIPGTNNTWFGLRHNDIVINVSTDNWVAATQVG